MEAKQWWVEVQVGLNNLAVVEGPQGPGIKKPVCKVHGGPEMWDVSRLIAAAPDLLAALEILTKHAQESYPHFESERGQRDIQAALTTIAKAKGVTP